jgi:hypothetical protein
MQNIQIILLVAALPALVWWIRRPGSKQEASPFWRALPLRRMTHLLLALFLSGASISFFFDLLAGGNGSRIYVLIFGLVTGVLFAAVFLSRAKLSRDLYRWTVLIVLVLSVAVSRALHLPNLADPSNAASLSAAGIRFDAFCIFISMVMGARFYRKYIVSEGVRQLRTEAELELAHQLQSVLVPLVKFRSRKIDVYGRSIPCDKVGGDLVDLVESPHGTLAYLVDVSGHGIPAGTLMGSVKSGVRMAAASEIPEMLQSLNRVLPSLKESHMYATMALIRLDETYAKAEYALAGHLPILHYCAANGAINRLVCEYPPLGLLPDIQFSSRHVSYSPGDLFVLFSDGLVETENRAAEQFGLDRLCNEVLSNASRSLDDVCQSVITAINKFGRSEDDQSLMLIRILA